MEQPAAFFSEKLTNIRAQLKDKAKHTSLLTAEIATGRRRKRNLRSIVQAHFNKFRNLR